MELPSVDDPVWLTYRDAYGRAPCNVITWIHHVFDRGLDEDLWNQFWEELHHQGDVGEASYGIIPYLVEYCDRNKIFDEQLFHFAVVVDLAREHGNNPKVPPELEMSYAKAINKLCFLGSDLLKRGAPPSATMGVAAAVAIRAGDELLARAYLEMGHAQAEEFLHNEIGYEHGSTDA